MIMDGMLDSRPERQDIQRLVEGLADLSGDGLDLVSEHAVRLRTDIAIVARLTRSVDVNLEAVGDLLEAGPKIYDGFTDAFNPELRAIDLRNSFSPLVAEALRPLFESLGVPLPCVPVDVVCPEGTEIGLLGSEGPVAADLDRPTTPIDDIAAALGSPTGTDTKASPVPASRETDEPWTRFL